jgi:hypothetical protein
MRGNVVAYELRGHDKNKINEYYAMQRSIGEGSTCGKNRAKSTVLRFRLKERDGDVDIVTDDERPLQTCAAATGNGRWRYLIGVQQH